ncbi:MAG: thiamine phosphate synthase, partial [Lachnospiraceae bacterium]|nr:thiamine phosphate synthase [Lachnospiraceae bacterium]
MKLQKDDLLLYAITDRSWLGDSTLTEQVEKALKGGITMLQLREKNMPYEQVRQTAIELKTL